MMIVMMIVRCWLIRLINAVADDGDDGDDGNDGDDAVEDHLLFNEDDNEDNNGQGGYTISQRDINCLVESTSLNPNPNPNQTFTVFFAKTQIVVVVVVVDYCCCRSFKYNSKIDSEVSVHANSTDR